jgi:hypothetical protein
MIDATIVILPSVSDEALPAWFAFAIVWHADVQVDAANGQSDAIPGHNSAAILADSGVPSFQIDADTFRGSPPSVARFGTRPSVLAASRPLPASEVLPES